MSQRATISWRSRWRRMRNVAAKIPLSDRALTILAPILRSLRKKEKMIFFNGGSAGGFFH